eukprot:12161511-Ditylum_brightwellii.AAC.1
MHQTKVPSGNPAIAQEIREAKSVLESEEKEDKEEDLLQELLVPHMTQAIFSLLAKKKAIELDEDKLCDSESNISAFKAKPFKQLKKEAPAAKPAVKKSNKAVANKTELLLVALSVLMSEKKKLMKQTKKTLEGKTSSYPCSFKKPDMETSMLCILQQQMRQWEENKATREQQLLMAYMERESSNGFITPTKSSLASPDDITVTTVSATPCEGEGEILYDDNDELEKAIAKET